MLLKLNGTLVGIDAPEDVNYIASFLRDAVTIVVAARYREKGIILPMLFGLLGAKKNSYFIRFGAIAPGQQAGILLTSLHSFAQICSAYAPQTSEIPTGRYLQFA